MNNVEMLVPETTEYGVWAVWTYGDHFAEVKTIHKDLRDAVAAMDMSEQICFWRYEESLKTATDRWAGRTTEVEQESSSITADSRYTTWLGKTCVVQEGLPDQRTGTLIEKGSLVVKEALIPVYMRDKDRHQIKIGDAWNFLRSAEGKISFEIGLLNERDAVVVKLMEPSVTIHDIIKRVSAEGPADHLIISHGTITEVWFN